MLVHANENRSSMELGNEVDAAWSRVLVLVTMPRPHIHFNQDLPRKSENLVFRIVHAGQKTPGNIKLDPGNSTLNFERIIFAMYTLSACLDPGLAEKLTNTN